LTGESTRAVHEAEPIDETTGSVTTPIYQSSTFGFKDAREVIRAVEGTSPSYVYSRWSNPTVARLESKLASLERAEDAAFFSSGMAAISTAVLSFVREGDHVVAIKDLYGESYRLIHDFLPSFGVQSSLVKTTDLVEMKRVLKKNTRVVYVETPTNPTLKLVDLAKAARLAHSAGALLLVDGTFASPVNQRPLSFGADLVLHSATKYLNGHADLVAGAVAGRRKLLERVKYTRRTLGGTLDPHAAWLVLRGMKTMAVRVRTQNRSAQLVAEYLAKHKKVVKVNYPGLKSHPQHSLAKKQMSGYGGMLSFAIKGDKEDTMKFTESLKVVTLAASLGGVESLVEQPATLSHTQMSEKERARTGILESLVRMSVGIEDVEDLISDLRQALAKV
jgi:methionine-gamma-lyase